MARGKTRDRRRWYSISVDTLRLLTFPLFALVLVTVGWASYGFWQEHRVKQRTTDILAQVEVLLDSLKTQEVKDGYRAEYDGAWQSYQVASQAAQEEDFRKALPLAVESRDVLLEIRSGLGVDGTQEATFLSVTGSVDFRRGERGRWQPARADVQLQPGDYVRTGGSGSAEIWFPDGSFFSVRKNSQVVISHSRVSSGETGDQSMEMEYGWVNLSTSKSPGNVLTPEAEARVDSNSEVFLSYERSSGTGRFGAIRGGMELRPERGEPRRIGELQQVVQNGEEVSESFPLPQAPPLVFPPENFEINSDQVREVTLSWEPVDGAISYALQVSDNHLFGSNIVEDMDRTKTSARLGIQAEGTFLWQVAARGGDGNLGPWSQQRRFRVASLAGRSTVDDHTPPVVEITAVRANGNYYIVRGQTEPGAVATINGEGVTVQADGTFTKTIEFRNDGAATIEVIARDAWGNEGEDSATVFVETP